MALHTVSSRHRRYVSLQVESLEDRRLLIVSSFSPGPTPTPSDEFLGVGRIVQSNGLTVCTASLLPTGRHVLTAAHCFGPTTATGTYHVRFDIGDPPFIEFPFTFDGFFSTTDDFHFHPDWDPTHPNRLEIGFDIAIIDLTPTCGPLCPTTLLDTLPRYELFRAGENSDFDEFTIVGHGITGWGGDPTYNTYLPPYPKHHGRNRFEATADELNGKHNIPGNHFPTQDNILVFDFDDGTSNRDAFGFYLGRHDFGLGTSEVAAHFFDSGGPSFVNGQVAGVTSFFFVNPNHALTDLFPSSAGSFGEIQAATRVSHPQNQEWVDSILTPRVVGVTIGTTIGNDNLHPDYAMPSGFNSAGQPGPNGEPCSATGTNCSVTALQLRTVPVVQPNEISIKFSEPMKDAEQLMSLTLTSAITSTQYAVSGPV